MTLEPMNNSSILLFIDSLDQGGAQKQFTSLACSLSRSGYSIYVAYYKKNSIHFAEAITQSGAKCLPFASSKKGFDFNIIKFLRKIISENNITTVISFLDTPSIYSAIAVIGLNDVNLIVSKRNSTKDKPFNFFRNVLDRFAIFMSKKVVTNSYNEANHLIKTRYCNAKKVLTIYNGYAKQNFKVSKNRTTLKKIMVLSRVNKQKNVIEAINALDIVRNINGLNIIIDWVGRADCDDSYLKKINTTINNRGLEKSFNFLGHLQNTKMLFQDYDAMLLPSLFEGMPNVLCEAMSCRLPVIATNISDNKILLNQGKRGMLAEGTSGEQIAKAIVDFYELSEEKRDIMVFNAEQFISISLSEDKMKDNYIRTLENLDK